MAWWSFSVIRIIKSINILQIISYCFVFHETIEFFQNKKTLPEILKNALLFNDQDLDVQMETCIFLTWKHKKFEINSQNRWGYLHPHQEKKMIKSRLGF